MRASGTGVLVSLSALLAFSACPTTTPPPATTPAFKVHYHRAAKDYTGWTVTASAGAVETAATASTSTDGWGAVFPLTVATGASSLTFTLQGTGGAEAQPFSVDVSGAVREVWVVAGFKTPVTDRPPAIPAANQLALYYKRVDTSYGQWGLHLWGDQVVGTAWPSPLMAAGVSEVLGAGYLIDLVAGGTVGNCTAGKVCFIVHQGETKDPGPDMSVDVAVVGNIAFVLSGSATVTSAPQIPGAVEIVGNAAHLLRRDVLAWNVGPDAGAASYELRWSPTVEVAVAGSDVVGGTVIRLDGPGALAASLAGLVPHLADYGQYTFDAGDLAGVKAALKSQLVAVARCADGGVIAATGVQTGFALDDLYGYEGPLGPRFDDAGVPTFSLWAPTANSVTLQVFDASKAEVASQVLTADSSGVWSYTGPTSWKNAYYRYLVNVYHYAAGSVETFTVVDPYSVNLSTNGLYSQLVDLQDPLLKPAGWDALVKPALAAPEDIVIYESHIRDFSVFDSTVAADRVGKFLAFAPPAGGGGLTAGQQHLQTLAQAGLTHVHVLPAFKIATVNEDPAQRVDINQPFADLCTKNTQVPAALCTQFLGKTVLQAYQSLAGDSDQQQVIAGLMAKYDSFNWGYDPFIYGAVQGSYASTAEGTAKIVEFRQMVMGLAGLGLRTVMDVVYNHTNASGPTSDTSVLDKVVPGYYYRLNVTTGSVETSSCCANTATERRMMERLMVDTLVRWARDYKVDGFRFDLMGLHLKANILRAKEALQALTPSADGVDGAKIYLYGEGWNMGEVQNNSHGTTATQLNMAGTGVGTFNDRVRDAVRGGGPFDNGSALRANQGFSNGLFYDPNELGAGVDTRAELLKRTDWIRVSMTGNLAEFRFQPSTGIPNILGGTLSYNGARAGYTLDPQEAINYVSAHDNQTLWDILAYKLPTGTLAATRVRAYDVALDTVLLGQGIPFFHMGDDILRSKSMEKDSYDSGDWFNQVDWSGHINGWKIGLPNAGKDASNWPVITPLFADATASVNQANLTAASTHFQEMLRIRKSSPLFRLQTGADVKTRVDFANTGPSQVPALLVMTITDAACAGADLDPARDAVVVIINADKVSHDVSLPGASGFTLHPILQSSADTLVRTASFTGTTFSVPARTSAVFEQLQSGAQAPLNTGVPCNTRLLP